MAHQQAAAAVAAYSFNGHGLRFLNEDWNDSISNGSPFTLTWNQSLIKAGAELGLFKVTYPANGVVVYDLVANLTDTMNSTSCVWTPEALKNELYAVWLTNGQQVHPNWTFSPPWIPKEKSVPRFRWAPIALPLVSLLVLYAICLSIYLAFRRRRREKRQKEDTTPHQDASRNDSVDSAITVQTIIESKVGTKSKPSLWIITRPHEEQDVFITDLWEDEDTAVEPVSRGQGLAVQSPV
ncbi:hypothetical protein NOR_02762 [Metarhizium rileyi]|uniref:Uncharacterized protein n=1 Tax=Metarhizium rileyi (strain RCEF 4871) TaxID=1649241 RepID=A0A167GV01_METRR|nr:hypothetical protein NOR_02762 [Metarhizium rileyi RCEF 4871]